MAFIKFRFPGSRSAASAEAGAASAAESLEVVRRRARHRLLGAVVLVLVSVVAFPLVFDAQPRPVSVDTPVLIPDRLKTPAMAPGQPSPAAQLPAAPLLPASEPTPVPVKASLDAGKEEVVSDKPAPTASAPSAPSAPEPKLASAPAASDKPPVPKADGDKARALLDGKAEASAEPKANGEPRTVIQVGAFTDAEKVREVRRKLEQAGLKTYTQVIEAKDGKRTVRVRVGPFESRAEADKAAQRIRKLDLPASVLVL